MILVLYTSVNDFDKTFWIQADLKKILSEDWNKHAIFVISDHFVF